VRSKAESSALGESGFGKHRNPVNPAFKNLAKPAKLHDQAGKLENVNIPAGQTGIYGEEKNKLAFADLKVRITL